LFFNPNTITLLALPLSLIAALHIAIGDRILASFFILLLGACDLLDGYWARKRGTTSLFGAFLDSTVDRLVELFLYMGVLFFYVADGQLSMALLSFWVFGGSFGISYTRARAENLIGNCRVGFWERPERIILLWMGIFFNRLTSAMWILAIGVALTLLHRILHTQKALGEGLSFSTFQKTLFGDYPRASWAYRAYAAFAVFLFFFLPFSS